MAKSVKFYSSSFHQLFRFLIVIIFLFGLMPAPVLAQTDGTIAGQVTDNTTGNPIEGASILVLESEDAPPSWNGNTDADGNYSISVPEGTGYLMGAIKEGYVSKQVTDLSVTANTTTTVNFSLLPGGIIQGTVTDNSTGDPIQNADVWAYQSGTPEVRYDALPTAADGSYSLSVPPETGYTVKTAKDGYVDATRTGVDAELASPTTLDIALQPLDSTPPADISNLTAGNPTQDSITLTWTAPGDDGTTGIASQYEIRYHTSAITDNATWNSATQAQSPPTPQTAGSSENFTMHGLSDNTKYYFAIKTRDDVSLWSGLSNSPSANTTVPPPPPYFNISHSQGMSSFMLGAGDNITETFNISSVNNFEGTINLDFNGPPNIKASSSLSPTQVTLSAGATETVTLTLGASAMTPSGTYQCGIGGQTSAYGGQQKGFFFTVNVGVSGQPLLSASPAVVASGNQTTFFISQFTPNEDVTLRWDSGPEAGQTLATGQIDGNGAWQVQVTISESMPGGNFVVKAITASSTAVFNLTITSGSEADFIMSASPEFISVEPGNSENVTVYVTSINGFNATVALSIGSPPGVTCDLSASSVTPGTGETASATLTVTVEEWASPDMYHINVDGACADPAISKMVGVNLDIPPPAEWGCNIYLSKSYGQAGDSITVTGSNFPGNCEGQVVTIKEAFSNTTLQTTPSTITVNNGGFTGTFTIPSGIPTGNYRIKAIVISTGDFDERNFQILGTGETFTLEASPQSVTVATEQGGNSASTSVNIFSVGGSSPSVNLAIEGAPSWLTYQFSSLPANTPAVSDNAVSVPAGGSASRNLLLTVSMTAPAGNYSITIKGWVTSSTEQRIPLELAVQPPAGFGMAQFTLSPGFGSNGRIVNFSGSGFTNCNPSRVTMLKFGELNILAGQNLPTINVPTSGDSAGKFSGTFRVPAVLSPGTYPVKLKVGSQPDEKFIIKSFTITGSEDTFVIQASPSFLWAEQGEQISTMIKVQAVGSSSANVSLSMEGCPNDITPSFASGNVMAPPGSTASTDLYLSISDWMPTGHYSITIKGQRINGAEVHRIPLEIDIAPPAGFDMASIYLSPTTGTQGTWITISGSGFPASTNMTHLYFGPNEQIMPSITTDNNGALPAVVMQVSANLTPGMYSVEVVVGYPPYDKRAWADFTLISEDASFNINLSPSMIHAAPGETVSTSLNVQSVGTASANVTLRVDGPPNILWRFDGGGWGASANVSPPIGSTIMSSLEIQPKASTPMGHYSLAVKATDGVQQEMRNLELDVGASDDYDMPIFSLNPSNGTAGTSVAFSGSNFPENAQVLGITFGGDNITLGQSITTSPQGSFSGSFTVPSTVGGQPITTGSYMVGVTVATDIRADASFNVYGDDDTFTISLSPNYIQGKPGDDPFITGILKALGGASPTVKIAVRGLPPGVTTIWDGDPYNIYTLSAPPGGQNNFNLTLVLPDMIPMGQYPAVLEGWVDSNQNNTWDDGEDIARVNLELSIMPPQGYGMGMLSLNPSYGRVGDTITFVGSGFPQNTPVTSLTFAQTDVLTKSVTTSDDGSFSGVFTVPGTAFGMNTGPGTYPVDVTVGTYPNDIMGNFEFQVITSNQKFSVSASPHWLVRPAGDTGEVSIGVRSLVTTPPSPTIIMRIEGLPWGLTPSFTTANVTPPVGDMESRELRLTISDSCPPGNYPISIKAYNAAAPAEELWYDFTLEVTPSSGFTDMGMATLSISSNFGSAGDQITVSGYGFPKDAHLNYISLGPADVTPSSVNITTDASGAFSAVITVPNISSGIHPLDVNVQNTMRSVPFNIMSENDTFSLKISPSWLEPIPAGDPNGRQIAITVDALPGKTPTVSLSTEGLFAAYGTIEEVWAPSSQSVNVTSAGGTATAMLILKPSENLPPGPYPFEIVAVDENSNRREFHMELYVDPPGTFMDSMMGMDQTTWDAQWQGTEWEHGMYFPEVRLSPKSGPAGTQVSYTGTNLPAGANVTSISFAGGQSVPLPTGGLTADSSGGFSGSFIVNEAWNLTPGMYGVEFYAEKDDGWSQYIMEDFNLMRSNAVFSLEVTPDWIPPIPPESFGQTKVNVKALGYSSVNVTLAVIENMNGWGIPGGGQAHWGTTDGPATSNVTVPAAGQASKTFYLQGANPGFYMITLVGWIDSNHNQMLDKDISSEAESEFCIPLDFEVEPPQEFKSMYEGFEYMKSNLNMDENDMYLFYFPEITLNPNMGPAGTKVSIRATDFPSNATVNRLCFGGVDLPVPSGTAANADGDFTLVFNVPKTMWTENILSGWYDVEVEAQKSGEPPVHIMKPFQVTADDINFTLRADPDWLPPIPPEGSGSTLIRVRSVGNATTVNLTVEKIPPGVDFAFSPSNIVTMPAGGSGSATLTLTPRNIPPGHYHAEIKGYSVMAEFSTHLEFEVEPPDDFMNWDRNDMMANMATMNQMGMTAEDWSYMLYFPEIMLTPSMGKAGTKVTIRATDFPTGANVTHLRFSGKELPVPANTTADNVTGDFTLVFNVPRTMWSVDTPSGWYDVEVEAEKPGEHPVFIMKPFQVTASDVAFTLRAEPDWLPPIPPEGSSTTIWVKSMGNAANITLSVDKIPPGITASFQSAQITVPPGGSSSTTLTLTPGYIPPGHYGAEIKGTATIDGNYKEFWTHIEFEVEPPDDFMNWDRNDMMANMATMNQMGMEAEDWSYMFYFPEIVLNPNMGKAGTKVTIKATDFPALAHVTHLRFAGMELPVPNDTIADNATGDFTLVFNVPKTIWGSNITSGWYDVEVEAEKSGEHPVFITKPFQVTASDVAFTLRAEPDWLPPIPPTGSSTTIRVKSMGNAANITLSVDKIPPGITHTFSPSNTETVTLTVPPGGEISSTLTLTPTNIPQGHYGAEIKGTATIDGNYKEFWTHIEFEVEPPMGFMTMSGDFGSMMNNLNMDTNDKYLFYFPEITLNPNMGQAGTKVSIKATDFPAGATVSHLRFASMELPVPTNTTADNDGDFTLVFNVPKTIWGGNIGSGWYDVEVEAYKDGEPPVFIMKPFQVTASDVAFTLRAEPDWLPPIPPDGSSTTIRVKSMGNAANVTLSVDKIPPGITASFEGTQVNVPPGGSSSTTLTLTPTTIPPGHYGAEIKGTATINGNYKEFYTHIEFEVEPPMMFMDTTWMAQQGVWFPEITLNPNAGTVKTKVSVKATDFPVGAEVTHLRFAGRELPVPANTIADSNGDLSLVFNVPSDFGMGQYMVEVEAQKTGMIHPVFIAKPFFIEDADVSFKLDVVPGFIPGVPQGDSGNTTIYVKATGQAVTVDLYVDGLPPGVNGTFDSDNLSVSPGGSSSTKLTITTKASTPPGHYPLTIRGVSGNEERMMPFGFGVTPPAAFQMPEFTLEPDFAPAGYNDKSYKVTFSGTGFPASQRVTSLEFGSQSVAIPENLSTDANGNFNGVFLMPTGLNPGTYDVRVAVATGDGGYIYDSRPFAIRSADAKVILKPSPPYLPPVVQGGQGTTMINVRSVGATTANVTLYVDGLAPGITTTFSPSNFITVAPGGSGSATLTFNVSDSTPPGPYPVSIRGVSGSEAAVVPLGFGVMPDIGGGEGHATITINPPRGRPGENIGISGAGFTSGSTITLTAAPPGMPTPIDITPGTIQVQTDGTWATMITIPEAGQVPPGTYIIKASDGAMASKNTFSIVPATNADFFLNVSPPFIEIVQGESGNTTMTLSSKNGFNERVVFGVGHLAPGVTATFKDSTGSIISKFTGTPGGIREVVAPIEQIPVPGEDITVTVRIDVDTDTPIGPYDIALEAGSGTVYRAVPLGLMVTSPGASLVISPMSGPADTDIRLSGTGFTTGETVTVTFAGTSITTIPTTITVAQDGTFTATITAPSVTAGIHPVSVTGATSGIIIDRPFGLKPSAVNTFVLYASPQKVDIPKGGSSTITTKIEPLGSFQSAVALSVSGLSTIAGATANISPSATLTPSIATPTTATLTINVPAGASVGRYPLVITATSGSITQTRKITIKVVPPADTPDFSISLAPNTVPISPNSSGNTTVTVAAINDFTGTVNLTVSMSDSAAIWPSGVSATTGNVTPSATTGLGKKVVIFNVATGTQPGSWTFKITGTSGTLEHSAEVMVVCTPSGTKITPYASPRLDPTTVTASTPMGMEPPWGDKITINGIINDGSEASVITPAKVDVTPDTLGSLPEGAADMLGRITNMESSAPVDGVEWDLGLRFDSANLTAAGFDEENLKVAYLNPSTGTWTEVTTTVDTTNKIAYASLDHFSSWTLIATPAPPSEPSEVVTGYSGGGGGSGSSGVTSLSESITTTGRIIDDILAESVDGKVELDIPKNTIGKNRMGQPLYNISIKPTAAPSAPPTDVSIIGLVYDLYPDGATFDPPISLTFAYDESLLPVGIDEENLVIATWQDENWVELEDSSVDPTSNTITAPISHFTVFTVMAHAASATFEISAFDISPAVVYPDESVTISVTITNTGDLTGSHEVTLMINGEMTTIEEVNLAGQASQQLTFTLKPHNAGNYAVNVNGLSATLIVREAASGLEEAQPTPSESPVIPSEAQPTQPEVTLAPTEVQPTPSEAPSEEQPTVLEAPAPPELHPNPSALPAKAPLQISLWLIISIAAVAIVIGIVIWRMVAGKKAS